MRNKFGTSQIVIFIPLPRIARPALCLEMFFLFHFVQVGSLRNSLWSGWHESMLPCAFGHMEKISRILWSGCPSKMPCGIRGSRFWPQSRFFFPFAFMSKSVGRSMSRCHWGLPCATNAWWQFYDALQIVWLYIFKGKFQGSWQQRSFACFELRKLRKPLVPEEMSNPAGSSDIVILDMYMVVLFWKQDPF